MKRVLFTLLLSSGFILNGFAVSETLVWNHPQYYNEGDCWVQALSRYEMGALYKDNPQYKPEFHFAKFYVKGDTIIDKKSYKCVQASIWYYNAGKEPSLTLSSEMSNVLFIREDLEGRQWRLLPGVPDEMLMFDFSESFKVGDTIRYGRHPDLLEWSLYLRRDYETEKDCFDPEYVYFTVEKVIKSVTTTELLNGNQVTIANESLAQGWGSIKEGDLFSQRWPDNESLTGRFLFRARQGKVLYEDAEFTDLISEIINQDVKELTLGVSQEHTYCPLVQSGKVWTFEANNHNVSPDYWTEWNETYSLEGDTVIDSHQCLKLYATSTYSYQPLNHAYQGALYEEDEKVYFIAPNGDISKLIYDFSCKEGDVLIIKDIKIHYETELYILQRRVIDYHGSSVTVIGWGPERGEHASLWDMWIEGVGSPLDLFDTLAPFKTGGFIKKLTACTLNGDTLYDAKSFQEAYKQRDTYRPLAKEGKVWNYRYGNILSHDSKHSYLYYSQVIQGDTVINDIAYKKLYLHHSRITKYSAALRDEGSKVYVVPADSTQESLYYDMRLGDSSEPVDIAYNYRVQKYGESEVVQSHGLSLTKQTWIMVNPLTTHTTFDWVESVGLLGGDFIGSSIWDEKHESLLGGELVSCFEDGQCIWGDEKGIPEVQREMIPLSYEAKGELSHAPSDIWVEYESGFLTFYFNGVQDRFILYVNGEAIVTPLYGTVVYTRSLLSEERRKQLNVDKMSYRLESDNEVFSFDLITAIKDIQSSALHHSSDHPYYDLSGRRLSTPPTRRGVYVNGGRKVLIQ